VPPLAFPDGNFRFDDGRDRISARLLLHVIARDPRRLRLAAGPVSERDAGMLNGVLAAWARAIGEPGSAPKVVAGRLMNARAAEAVDFRGDAGEEAVLGGFFAWEGTYRWMGARGELRMTLGSPSLQLVLAAPISRLRAKRGWEAITLAVTAVEEATGTAVPLGTVRVAEDGPSPYVIDAAPFLARFRGRSARLVLAADHTWRPSEVLDGSQDPRDLSVIVMAVGPAPP
jgi:hypothetical protein